MANKAFVHDKGVPILVGILLTGFIAYLSISSYPPVEHLVQSLESLAYDFRFQHTLAWRDPLPAPVVIVDIDERSLHEIGRWPWDRNKVAKIVENLYNHGVVVIGFDILFSEEQKNNAEAVFEKAKALSGQELADPLLRQQLLASFAHDEALAASLAHGDSVLGILLHSEQAEPKGVLPAPIMNVGQRNITIPKVGSYTANVPILQDAAVSGGFVTTIRDGDGVIRRTPMILQEGGNVYGSLSLEVAKAYLFADKVTIETNNIGSFEVVSAITLDKTVIHTDTQGRVLVPFRGGRNSFPYVSATDILHDRVDPSILEGTIVLMGTSALGLGDLQSTAVGAVFPGVEVHANNVAGILNQRFPNEPVWASGANFILLVLVGMTLAIIFPLIGPGHVTWLALAMLSMTIGFNVWLWVAHDIVLEIVLPILLVIGLVLISMSYGFLFEARRKRQITEMFGQYVSSDIVEEMSADPEHYTFEGRSIEMTVLFADIRNFTSISEKLTAQQLKDVLNRYFEPMTKIIFDTSGTVDKYVGDMIMAFWGAPKEDPEQATHAVTAAIKMQQQSTLLSEEFKASGLPEVSIGIGLNTGVMNVGDMGSIYRRAYTVLGDNVNLSSRLEASTKYYGAKILVGETTKEQAPGYIYQKIDFVRVKGKEEPVAIYEPLCAGDDVTEELKRQLEQYQHAHQLYCEQQWDEAIAAFAELAEVYPERLLYKLYLNRCHEFKDHPPGDDWDGSYTRTEK